MPLLSGTHATLIGHRRNCLNRVSRWKTASGSTARRSLGSISIWSDPTTFPISILKRSSAPCVSQRADERDEQTKENRARTVYRHKAYLKQYRGWEVFQKRQYRRLMRKRLSSSL